MRTVSFSPDVTRDLLHNEFVCFSVNTEGDPSAGSSMAHAPSDTPGRCTQGIGKQNVQSLFLTPDGEIFHVASGHQGPEDFRQHLESARALFAEIREQPDRASRIVRDVHQRRLDNIQADDGNAGQVGGFLTQFARLSGRNGRLMPTSVDTAFDLKTRDAEYNDNRYMVERPLVTFAEFQRNPRELVGHEQTAFASVGNGGASGGQIGR